MGGRWEQCGNVGAADGADNMEEGGGAEKDWSNVEYVGKQDERRKRVL